MLHCLCSCERVLRLNGECVHLQKDMGGERPMWDPPLECGA